ncbi:MAG TPA: glucoamylase family protein [Gemmatimonadaceae bacterium]|nr:glucoamylase family protein [Gemmatimonadaceae bacterium]
MPLSDERLERLEQETFTYFWKETNPENGLLPDNTLIDGPASIAGVGLALSAWPVGVERGFVDRAHALQRALATLRFFWNSVQSTDADATGHHGFYYHFLDVKTGRRAWKCELSTIDTAILIAGALAAAACFDRDSRDERELRELAGQLYERIDWRWAQNGGLTVSHGWTPERGFLPYRWEGYCEAILLYALGLGSPTFPLPEESYERWAATYRWKTLYGQQFLYGGPLFMHQLSHMWIDFRGIQDAFMRDKGIDYFENSRRATYVQQAYAMRNPKRFDEYGQYAWGITASNGPGPATRRLDGVTRRFLGYRARGVPYGPDDGTLAPWAVAASLPFAPEIVLPTLRYSLERFPKADTRYGLVCSVNPTFRTPRKGGWISSAHFALDQGPVILMIENYRSGLIWRLMRRCSPLVTGLRRAGFSGGWLDGA